MSTSIEHPAERAAPESPVQAALLSFLQSRTSTAWDVDVDLFADGGVSSLFAMELVVFVEQEFDVEVGGEDLVLDNFRTVRSMAALVARLREDARA
ncbi:MAG: methoxymalonate biosynthesis acyl carrier protein [Solirubrobacteraceae bacterium]|jgi:methoxymalonate biosynthesis acyl carrier protein|nr:methoxymalonate biosynthesis acyl carrier protein [Solirubrobacteraceae bacterium]